MSKQKMPALPGQLPWVKRSYLLLDGVSVENLPQKLYQWSDNPVFEPLYLQTSLQELVDLSPCLIEVGGEHDSVMQAFINSAEQEWGCLLFSRANFGEILQHLRWLVQVEPAKQQEAYLRFADPAVAHQLLSIKGSRLFGPIEHLYAPDAIEGVWHEHLRTGSEPIHDRSSLYRLNDQEMKALEDVSFRQAVIVLDSHMEAFFPSYQRGLSGRDRYKHMYSLAEQAYQRGLCSQREILLFANVFGFLGDQVLEQHADVAHLLSGSSPKTPGQRVELAAQLAQQRATNRIAS
ncbi:MAG: hypothetical protein CMK78_09960 [Pseudomonadales bacterium]|nr:hypothetical protein [Pseudomonadales bacterium]